MRNLVPYSDDTFTLYEEAVKKMVNGESKLLLTDSKRLIKGYYDAYDLHFEHNTLTTLPAKTVNGKLHKELYNLYGSGKAVVRKIHSHLVRVNPTTVIGICQYCGINTDDTMDHILPRSAYAEYSINAKNLIPCCSDCNRRKNSADVLNLYTDKLPNVEYLFMDVIANSDTIDFRFRLDNSRGEVDPVLFEKISKHFSRLDLCERMRRKAQSALKGFVSDISTLYNCFGKEIVMKFIMESLPELRSAYGFNYWEVVFRKGLVNSTVFWEYYETDKLH